MLGYCPQTQLPQALLHGGKLPKAPITHKVAPIGKSHSAEIKVKRINAMAYQRQKSRQYRTSSKTWRSIRAEFLAANPLCVMCELKGLTRMATHLDHVDGDSWNNNQGNYQGLCHSCHSTKTNREDGGFGNKKRL